MTLKTTLLASVALCGLMAAPALARSSAPNFHLAGRSSLPLTAHVKTNAHVDKATHFTSTVTFSASLSVSEYYKQKIDLLGESWFLTTTGGTCIQPTKQKWVGLPKKTTYAKVGHTAITGTTANCPDQGPFTFQTITYDLVTIPANPLKKDKDTVAGNLVANNFDGYDLKLVATVDISFTK